MTTKHILVVGAGAVGCFYASKLDRTHAKVGLVCRSNYQAVHDEGVNLETHSFGNYHFQPDFVFPSTEAAKDTTWDYVVVATKALSMDSNVAKFIAPVVQPSTTIVLIQNGVEIEAPYRTYFPRTPIVSAVTVASLALTQPSCVVQYRWTRISLGPYTDLQGSTDTPEKHELYTRARAGVQDLVDLFTRGGIRDAEAYDALGLQMVRWHKLCINASMNVSGVLAGNRGNADMVQDPRLRAHIEACMHEVLDAAPKIFGQPLPDKFATPEAILRSTERNVGSRSSMVQDWEAGRALELDAIIGNAIRIGEKHGASMPRLQSMYALLRSAQEQREKHT
ncbi:2-dehydropantoate 2-reductase [Malassezia pachydermatis]|uniref:2-dehydropantoate 2-reductase n=1 Tax=Malassezia pachydermatis TaxID=77020 RepID=A0A0M8MLH9_9BASI|nr:2-dehydropantoate 2-reductase [Malassezia pachydermatis]KOS12517.1 2-dehydropantoate 2-reductase [Malassezia pachydermatis]